MILTKLEKEVLSDALGNPAGNGGVPRRNNLSLYMLSTFKSTVDEMVASGLLEYKGNFDYSATEAGKQALLGK
jgi:hypothetical protein